MITEQLSLPLCLDIIYSQTATSGTFTLSYSGWVSMQMSRDDALRDNIRRAWAGISIIAMFAIPIAGVLLKL